MAPVQHRQPSETNQHSVVFHLPTYGPPPWIPTRTQAVNDLKPTPSPKSYVFPDIPYCSPAGGGAMRPCPSDTGAAPDPPAKCGLGGGPCAASYAL